MSSPSSSLRGIDVAERRSDRRLAGLGLAMLPVGMMVALAGAGSPRTLAWYVLFSLLSAGACVLGLRREGILDDRRRILRIAALEDGHWSLTDAQGTSRMRLLPGTRVGRGWLWLQWAPLQSRATWLKVRSLLLTGKDLPAADMRRLQAYLRMQGLAEHPLRNGRGAPASKGRV